MTYLIFRCQGYLCLPYMALQQHHLLSDVTVRGFVAGATNILFRQQRHLSDAIIDVSPEETQKSQMNISRSLQVRPHQSMSTTGGRGLRPDPGPGAPEGPQPNHRRPALRRLPAQTRDGEPPRRLPGRDRLGGWRRVDPLPVCRLPSLATVLSFAGR